MHQCPGLHRQGGLVVHYGTCWQPCKVRAIDTELGIGEIPIIGDLDSAFMHIPALLLHVGSLIQSTAVFVRFEHLKIYHALTKESEAALPMFPTASKLSH